MINAYARTRSVQLFLQVVNLQLLHDLKTLNVFSGDAKQCMSATHLVWW